MKVVCINISNTSNRRDIKKYLTLYKVYDVRSYSVSFNNKNEFYIIKDDSGKIQAYKSDRFITLDEWRNLKISEIITD